MNTDAFGLTDETVIRDSLYDLIPLSREAAALARHPRLPPPRRHPAARLRLARLAGRQAHALRALARRHAPDAEALERLIAKGAPISDETARTAIAAALLHDIGHYPFSHAIEELGPPVLTHEQVGRQLIEGDEIAPILRDRWHVDPARVARLVHPGGLTAPARSTSWSEVFSAARWTSTSSTTCRATPAPATSPTAASIRRACSMRCGSSRSTASCGSASTTRASRRSTR